MTKSTVSPDHAFERLRALCLDFPEAREVEAWGAPTFRVKTIFAMYSAPDHEGPENRGSVWLKTDATDQQLLIQRDPTRFFAPPYVGPKGWTGVYLDGAVEWEELADLLWDAWRKSVPKKLLAAHPERPS